MPDEPVLDIEHFRARLLTRRNELTGLAASEEEAAERVEVDQQRIGRLSRMDAMRAQAMAEETNRRRKWELKRIEAALDKIAAGDYGDCDQCGEPIAVGRLEFDPAAELCIDCAQQAESG
jgi:DnaK suppressor protein